MDNTIQTTYIVIFTILSFVLGYACKAFICIDNQSQIESLEEELDAIHERYIEVVDNINNTSCIQAVPVEPSAPQSSSIIHV